MISQVCRRMIDFSFFSILSSLLILRGSHEFFLFFLLTSLKTSASLWSLSHWLSCINTMDARILAAVLRGKEPRKGVSSFSLKNSTLNSGAVSKRRNYSSGSYLWIPN